MTHGYDDQGSRFGPNGNFENWWTRGRRQGLRRAHRQAGQAVRRLRGAAGLKVNGKLTLGENIADLGGLATAYDAMKAATAGTPDPMIDGLTRDQRFFLNWAHGVARQHDAGLRSRCIVDTDPHAPAQFRAIGAPSNLPAFAAAFQCKAGDAMVRGGDKQVVIW